MQFATPAPSERQRTDRKKREFVNQRLESEQAAEVQYEPGQCARACRLVILRKNISGEKGEDYLFPEISYFF